MLTEELLRQQLWDQLSGGMDVADLLRDDADEPPPAGGLTSRLMRMLGRSGPAATGDGLTH